MNHDPLCPFPMWDQPCPTCDDYARVRADERRLEAERRAKKFGVWHDYERDLP